MATNPQIANPNITKKSKNQKKTKRDGTIAWLRECKTFAVVTIRAVTIDTDRQRSSLTGAFLDISSQHDDGIPTSRGNAAPLTCRPVDATS